MNNVKKIEKTIQTLIGLLSLDESVNKILMNLKILNYYLENNDLDKWLKLETEGYDNEEDLPAYRITGALIYTAGARWDGARFNMVNVPVDGIKDESAKKYLSVGYFLQPIAELEDLCKDDNSEAIITPLPLWTYEHISAVMQMGYEVDQAHKRVSSSMVKNIVVIFKNKVLDLLFDLNREFDVNVDFEIQSAKMNNMVDKNIPATIVANNSTVTISGENVNVGNGNSIQIEGAKLAEVTNILNQLEEVLETESVPDEVLEYIQEAKKAAETGKNKSVLKMAFTALKGFVTTLPEQAGALIQAGLSLFA